MKKIGVFILFFLVIFMISLSLTIVSAQNSTEEKASSCLKNKVEDKCSILTIEEQALSLMALSDNSAIKSECKSSLESKSTSNECWPSAGCKIKETALALLSLNYINADTGKAEDWLLSKNITSTNLEWYLEIDASEQTSCKLIYDSSQKSITIAENKVISGNPGTCFSLAYNDYWLKISDSCLRKNFTVSCDKDFFSTLLYKKSQGNIWHVSSDVQSASASGTTEHKVNSFCFSTLTSCNYEENLWAVLALNLADKDINSFLPYLIAFSDENEKYFPYSVLYYLTNEEEYLTKILNLQKTEGYWDLASGKSKFYDTAIALLAVSDSSESETNAKSWLEENQDKTGNNEGCWNSGNIRDTAFLLWAGWPATPSADGGVTENNCEDFDHHCTSQGECDNAGGTRLSNFVCPGMGICCDREAVSQSCAEQDGEECAVGEECSVDEIPTSDSDRCCLGTCSTVQVSECEQKNYNCRSTCLDTEEEATYTCTLEKICCKETTQPATTSYWWIWLLVILIILVILGILFRNKLRIFSFKLRGGVKSTGVTTSRPPFFPPSAPMGLRRMMPMTRPPMRQPQIMRPVAKAASKVDKELEETLKKLKEMSR